MPQAFECGLLPEASPLARVPHGEFIFQAHQGLRAPNKTSRYAIDLRRSCRLPILSMRRAVSRLPRGSTPDSYSSKGTRRGI
jgi:hypothetical protein